MTEIEPNQSFSFTNSQLGIQTPHKLDSSTEAGLPLNTFCKNKGMKISLELETNIT